MRAPTSKEPWCRDVRLWNVVVIVLALGTLPGAASSWALSHQAKSESLRRDRTVREALLAGCERSNKLRSQVNTTTGATVDLKAAVHTFAIKAAAARQQSGDERVARDYDQIAAAVDRIKPSELGQVNCETAYPEPTPDTRHNTPAAARR